MRLKYDGRFYWTKSSYFLSLVKREGDSRTKVLKSEERFDINRFKAGIKSLAAKATLPLQKGEKDKEVNMKKMKGFTLIELLVVVLIIAILAAIALPKYQQTVFKARFANVLNVAESLKKAQELYYLVNGAYIADMSKLDWDFKENCNLFNNDVVACDKYFMIDLLNGVSLITNPTNYHTIRIVYCPTWSNWTDCPSKAKFHYTVWLDHSSYPGLRTCSGVNDEGKKLCKILGF